MKNFFKVMLIAFVTLTSCSSDDEPTPEVEVPEEVITNIDIALVSDTETLILSYVDIDGIGFGETGITTEGTLKANTTYKGAFTITNVLADEEEERNVTAEISELDDDHQFFFIATNGDLDITITYDDLDDNGNPVGLFFTLTTGAISSGDFNVILRHEPNKTAEGVFEGDIANEDQGESDFDIIFPLLIE